MQEFAKVIVDISESLIDKVFDYKVIDGCEIGSRVIVPFGNRNISGIIISLTEECEIEKSKIKQIIKVQDNPITKENMELALWMTEKYHTGKSDVLRLFIPSEVRKQKVQEKLIQWIYCKNESFAQDFASKLTKNATKQKNAIAYLIEKKQEKNSILVKLFGASAVSKLVSEQVFEVQKIAENRVPNFDKEHKSETPNLVPEQKRVVEKIESTTKTYLLHGVTGSGKTEVYLTLMQHQLSKNKTGILLVPEISLTPQMLSLFKSRFGESVAILHSGLSVGERYDEWQRINKGEARIVIGARSAIFAPVKDLGLIVIDEEHESSYQSETNPRYSAISVAEKRAEISQCSLVLGSATPSLETYHKAIKGEYELVEMTKRINGKELPQINIVDMTDEFRHGNTGSFSSELKNAITDALSKNNQVMIFINRRGYTSFVSCKECGWVAKCPSCDVSLVYHKAEKVLKCHYCGSRFKVFDKCPNCGNEHLSYGATGTQKVVEELKSLFPNARIARMDNDTTRTKNSHTEILKKFREHETDILVGTQMIAKGHDFPKVTVVGIVDSDISLHQSSYNSCEKTFQLVTQVSGRAGRSEKEGKIILQTNTPRHYVYRMAKNYDYIGFYKKESNIRECTKYPPFAEIVRILFKSSNEELAKSVAKEYYDRVKILQSENKESFYHLGVMRSPISKIENQYRFQIVIRVKNDLKIEKKIFEIADEVKTKNVLCFVEINPQNMS